MAASVTSILITVSTVAKYFIVAKKQIANIIIVKKQLETFAFLRDFIMTLETNFLPVVTRQTTLCSKSSIETLKNGAKYVQN